MGEGIKLPVINGLGRTDRIDNWWAQPFWMGLALTAALIYTAWRLIIFPDSIYYDLEGSKVVSPIFSPTIQVIHAVFLDLVQMLRVRMRRL